MKRKAAFTLIELIIVVIIESFVNLQFSFYNFAFNQGKEVDEG